MPTFRTLRRRSLAIAALAALAAGAAVLGTQSVLQLAQAASIQGDVYVSPGGDDADAGTAAAPVKTLARAQSLVRGLNQSMSADVTVVLADGFYRLSAPLR